MHIRPYILSSCVFGLVSLFAGETGPSDAYIGGAHFENYTLYSNRSVPRWGLDDYGNYSAESTNSYWHYSGEHGNYSAIKKYEIDDNLYNRWDASTNPRPSWWGFFHTSEAEENFGFASIEVSPDQLMKRALEPILPESASTGPNPSTLIDGDMYFDALLKFSMFTEPMPDGFFTNGVDKIGFGLFYDAENFRTNFTVFAGRVNADGSISLTNYVTTAEVCQTNWYRVTVKTIYNASVKKGDEYVGFVLYLDGQRVSCLESNYGVGPGAQAVFGTEENYLARALFPSLQRVSEDTDAPRYLTGVAMSGTVGFDEFALTYDNPLAVESGEIDTVVVFDETALTVDSYYELTRGGVTTKGALVNGVVIKSHPGDVLELFPVLAEDVEVELPLIKAGNTAAIGEVDDLKVTYVPNIFSDSGRLTLTLQTTICYFKLGDETYASFNDLMDDVYNSSKTAEIELMRSITLSANPADGNYQLRVRPTVAAKLDLCGNTITGLNDYYDAAIYDQGSLQLFDSVGGGKVIAPGVAIEVAVSNDALWVNHDYSRMVLGAEDTKDFSVIGRVRRTKGELVVMGGAYTNPGGGEANRFYLADYVPWEDGCYVTNKVADVGGSGISGFEVKNPQNLRTVRFASEIGSVTPSYLTVVSGGTVDPSQVTLNAPGYRLVEGAEWYLGEEVFDFSTPITSGITLEANVELENYTITYSGDGKSPANPTSYNIMNRYTELGHTSSNCFDFVGWRDVKTMKFVDAIGEGAKYRGTDEAVIGDLELESVWEPSVLKWSNTIYTAYESNGWYRGAWKFSIPVQASKGMPRGRKMMIDQVSFSIVNPVQYPATADYLAVTNLGVFSAKRGWRETEYGDRTLYDVPEEELLGNSRARLDYDFSDFEIEVGSDYYLMFSSAADTLSPTNAFLRFTKGEGDGVFGKCLQPGGTLGDDKGGEYMNFYPVYEVRGRIKEGGAQ